MLKFDIPESQLQEVVIPEDVFSPTGAPLVRSGWLAAEVCIQRKDLPMLMLSVRQAGGKRLVFHDVQGFLD